MNRSQFLAALIGPPMVIVALSLLINRQLLAEIEMITARPGAIFLFGVLGLILGLAVVIGHNVWRGWPILITLLGWNAMLAGAFRILMPHHIAGTVPHVAAQSWVLFLVVALFLGAGAFLTFKAFRP